METRTERERLERVLRGQHKLMDEVHQWLEDEDKQDRILRAVVLSSAKERPVHIPDAQPERIFHRDTIRSLCIKYQLRFLDAGLFKGGIPDQAIGAVRQLERQVGAPITSFKMMAPGARFRLSDSEVDPLLFVPLGNDRYYLVHKWGSDLDRWRVLAGWPFRGPLHLGLVVLMIAMTITALMPAHLITSDPSVGFWGGHRLLFFFWITMVCTSFTVFSWFAFFGQFSSQAWNSKYFNG
jgi:hypothetical protein